MLPFGGGHSATGPGGSVVCLAVGPRERRIVKTFSFKATTKVVGAGKPPLEW